MLGYKYKGYELTIISGMALLFLIVFMLNAANAQIQVDGKEKLSVVKTASSTDTDIGANKHVLTLYSAPVRTYNGSAWLDFIKTDYVDGYYVGYTEIDKDEFIWVTNITDAEPVLLARVCMNVSSKYENVQLPLTKATSDLTASNTAFYKLSKDETYCVWTDISSMKTVKFGEHSTIIKILFANETDDTSLWGFGIYANYNYGTDTYTDMCFNYRPNDWYMQTRWKIDYLPASVTINSAIVEWEMYTGYLNLSGVGRNATITAFHTYQFPSYNLNGVEWTEENVAWANRSLNSTQMNMTQIDSLKLYGSTDADFTHHNWTVTQALASDYYNGYKNFSVQYNCSAVEGTFDGSVAARFYMKESAGREPTLYIVYTEGGGDVTPPSPYFSLPANNSYTNNITSVLMFVNASENIFCTLQNGTVNISMTSSGTSCIYNMTGQSNQTQLNYRVFANDTTGNHNSTGWWRTTINLTNKDTTTPQPVYVSPTLANNSYTNNVSWIYVNASAGEAISYCILQNATANLSMTANGVSCSYNFTNLANLTQRNFRVYFNDTSGNMNTTEWRRITINLTNYYPCTPARANITWTWGGYLPPTNAANISCNASDLLTLNWTNNYWNWTTEWDTKVCGGANITYYANGTIYNYTYQACDNCTPVLGNTSASSPQNTTPSNYANVSCNASDILTLNWTWVQWSWWHEWDTLQCQPDNVVNITWYDNVTWYNYSYQACTFCTPLFQNDTWTYEGNTTPSYANVTGCNISGNLTQYANWTEWNWTTLLDFHACSGYGNTTIYYDNLSWGNWSILTCAYVKPPEPGPIFPVRFLFNYFGYSTISWGRSSGITDTTSYWLCTANDCSTTCRVHINGGLITDCV